jgi:hypothetical protein
MGAIEVRHYERSSDPFIDSTIHGGLNEHRRFSLAGKNIEFIAVSPYFS